MQVTVVHALMEAKVRTTVRSYNDMKATKAAVSNLFPGFSEACVERPVEDGVFLLEAMRPLDRFFELLREQRILDTAMDVMAQGIVDDRTTFRLNRLSRVTESSWIRSSGRDPPWRSYRGHVVRRPHPR